jgi:Spy/CpxP family protein refolding chaperone
MTKAKIMVIFGFLIAFGAGAVVGIQMQKPSIVAADVPKKPEDRSWLRTELGLTSEQTAQMKAIWDSLHAGGRSHEDRRHRLREERDEAIAALIPPSGMGDYDKVLLVYSDKMNQLGQERDKAFQDAVARTMKILTPEQQAKYQEFMKRRDPNRPGPPGMGGPPPGGFGGGPGGPGSPGRRPDSRPSTRPAPR